MKKIVRFTKILKSLALIYIIWLLWSAQAWAMPSYDDVLVVANSRSSYSNEIADYFIKERHIPAVNKCSISVSTAVWAAYSDRVSASQQIRDYLAANGLADKINYIILSTDFPIYSKTTLKKFKTTTPNPGFDIAIMFDLANPGVDIMTWNPYYYYIKSNRSDPDYGCFMRKKYGYYIVSRLDGSGAFNIKKLIDGAGAPAYESYKKGIRFATNNITEDDYPGASKAYLMDNVLENPKYSYGQEFMRRGNVENYRFPFSKYIATNLNNIMFMVWDWASAGVDSQFLHIQRKWQFLPGSFGVIRLSYPNQSYSRTRGGLSYFKRGVSTATDLRKIDGSDLGYRHMTSVTLDQVNQWIWVGTGSSQIEASPQSGTDTEGVITSESERGTGVVVYDKATKAFLTRYTTQNGLLANRVNKVAYDPHHKRIWAVTYHGIQYFDLQTKTWSAAIEGLSCRGAAAYDLLVDPYDSDKIYVGYYSSSRLSGAAKTIYEYSKNTGSIRKLVFSGTLYYPYIAKTDIRTLWVLGYQTLYKYDLIDNKILSTIPLKSFLSTGCESGLRAARLLFPYLKSSQEKYVFVGLDVLKGDRAGCEDSSKLLRIKETGASTHETLLIENSGWMVKNQRINAMAENPLLSSKGNLYLAFNGQVWESKDSKGEIWALAVNHSFTNLRDIAVDTDETIYGVQGYEQYYQQPMTDFQHFGACSTGGGMEHVLMVYDPNSTVKSFQSNPTPEQMASLVYNCESLSYSAQHTSSYLTPTYATALRYLDGFNFAESRFPVFYQYVAEQGAVMTIFEPKMSAFAPRVDEERTSTTITDPNKLTACLINPGLPDRADHPAINEYGFSASTINTQTVFLKDNLDNTLPIKTITYKETPKDGKMSFGIEVVPQTPFKLNNTYKLHLICGAKGIKNKKGAALTNTRADEFSDSITLIYSYGDVMTIGDLSGDGKVSAYDAALASKIAARGNPTADELKRGDVNSDGKIDALDVLLISKKAVGLN